MPELILGMFIFDKKCLSSIFSGLKIGYDDRKVQQYKDFSVLPGGCGNQNQQYKVKLWIEKFCKNWFWIEGCIESNVYYKEKLVSHMPIVRCLEMA